jgi:hypothetical protein
VPELVGDYGSWSAAMSKAGTSVAVLYSSEYGFSDRLSQTLARGVTKAGVAVRSGGVVWCDVLYGIVWCTAGEFPWNPRNVCFQD